MDRLDDLFKLAYGFAVSKIIFTSVKFGIYSRLSGNEKSASELASELSVPERSLSRLLNSCTAMGIIKKKNGKYFNSSVAEEFLVEGKPEYFGFHLIALNERLYGPWGNLEDIIRKDAYHPSVEGKTDDIIKAVASTKEFARKAMMSQHNYSQQLAKDFANEADLSKCKKLLDVGGGTGILSVEAVKKYPNLEAVVFDRANVLEVAKDIIAENGVNEKVKVYNGDLMNDPFPEGGDAALLSGVLDGYNETNCRIIIKKIYDYLPKEGLFFVTESVINDERSGPVFPSIFSLILLLQTKEGDARSQGEMTQWMSEAGFADIKYKVLEKISGHTRNTGLLIAVKK